MVVAKVYIIGDGAGGRGLVGSTRGGISSVVPPDRCVQRNEINWRNKFGSVIDERK